MELLKERVPTPHLNPVGLLPHPSGPAIAVRLADALDNDAATLTELGIARITDSSKTKAGVVFDTHSYMSPEQPPSMKIHEQSNLFSLGVTLNRSSYGGAAFDWDALAELLHSVANDQTPNLVSWPIGLPSCVAAITANALFRANEDRVRSSEEMVRAVREGAASMCGADVTP